MTTLLIPGHNDSESELRQIAEFISSVGNDIPWHVTQFSPTYRLLDRAATPVKILRRPRAIGYEAGLQYVYEGNVPGEGVESTHCHQCKSLLVQRYGTHLLGNRMHAGKCPDCDTAIPGVWRSQHDSLRRGAARHANGSAAH